VTSERQNQHKHCSNPSEKPFDVVACISHLRSDNSHILVNFRS
jgi:hypothetical protein